MVVYGWSGPGGVCVETAQEAANLRCADSFDMFVAGTSSLAHVGICASVSASACASPTGVGNTCTATFTMTARNVTGTPAAAATNTIAGSLQPCVINDAAVGLTPTKVTDYMALWSAFMVAAVVVLCVKAIYKRFKVDYDH